MAGIEAETEKHLRKLLSERRLKVRLEIRDADSEEVIYGFTVSDNVRPDDRLVIKHQVGDFVIQQLV